MCVCGRVYAHECMNMYTCVYVHVNYPLCVCVYMCVSVSVYMWIYVMSMITYQQKYTLDINQISAVSRSFEAYTTVEVKK